MKPNSRINVSVLTTSFPRFEGDFSGNFIFKFVQELSHHAANIEVVAPDDISATSLFPTKNFKIVRFPYFFPKSWQTLAYGSGIMNRRNLLAWVQLPLFLISFFCTALRSAREAHLVHSFWSASAIVALAIRGIKPKPVVVTLWGSDMLVFRIPVISNLISMILKKADAIICEDYQFKSHLVSLDFDPEKISIINNGIDLSHFQPHDKSEGRKKLNLDNSERILLSVGSLNKNKAHALLINAFAEMTKTNSLWSLYIVGEGEERMNLEKQILDLELGQKVRLLGFQDHNSLLQWLNSADIFVLPSLSEGTPNALLEAMSCGLPVVASKVGGIPDLVQHEKEGLLFEPGSKDDLKEKLERLIGDREFQIALGKNACEKVTTQYGSWKNQAEKLLSMYQQLLSSS